MRRLAAIVTAVVALAGAGVVSGCSVDPYAPYDFKRIPGYTPPGGISSPPRLTALPVESQR